MANPKKTPKSSRTRFDKIVKAITEKSSPSEPMANEDESDAIDQEGKKRKLKSVDLPETPFK